MTPTAPAPERDRRWLIMVVVAIAQLMVVLDATIVNIALPSAQADLGFADSERQWVITAYALAFGSLLLLGGRLGDMFGRKWTFIGGLAGFAVASAVGGAANSFAVLVTARALQGVFGALLAPAVLGTLVTTFREPKDRAKAFGIFGTVAVSGSAVGLILGGVLTEYLSWRWCLYVNLVFAGVAGVGAWRLMRNERPAQRPRIDYLGTVLASAGLFGIVFGFSRAEAKGWGAPITMVSLTLGVVLLVSFIGWESRASHPLLPLRVVRDRARGAAYTSVAIATISMFGVFLFLTYFMQRVKGYSPVMSGVAYLPLVAGIIIMSNLSSIVLLPKYGPRRLLPSGMALGVVSMLGFFYRLTPSSDYVTGLLPGLIILGFAMGGVMAPAINTATVGVSPADSGVASALVNTMQQVGGSVGTSVLSTIAASATTSYLVTHRGATLAGATHGYTTAFAVGAIIFIFGAIMNILVIPSADRLRASREAAALASRPGPLATAVPASD
jgi:EmrB/QacA subfamily drug resistance transporter